MNDMVSSHALHRITVDEYHRMYDAGIFAPDARIELIEGELLERLFPMNPPHANVVTMLLHRLILALGDRAYVRCQVPITLGDLSEPQPDLSVVAMPASAYKHRHPTCDDIFTIIEVADSSRKTDLERKVPLYAAFRIPETCVVDLVKSKLHIFRDPRNAEYASTTVKEFTEPATLLAFPDQPVVLADIFS